MMDKNAFIKKETALMELNGMEKFVLQLILLALLVSMGLIIIVNLYLRNVFHLQYGKEIDA